MRGLVFMPSNARAHTHALCERETNEITLPGENGE